MSNRPTLDDVLDHVGVTRADLAIRPLPDNARVALWLADAYTGLGRRGLAAEANVPLGTLNRAVASIAQARSERAYRAHTNTVEDALAEAYPDE